MAKKPLPAPSSSLQFNTVSGLIGQSKEELVARAHAIKSGLKPGKPSQEEPPHPDDVQAVLDALLLTDGARGAAGLHQWLQAMGVKHQGCGGDQAFQLPQVTHCLQTLQAQGLADVLPGRGYVADLQSQAERLQTLLLRPEAPQYWRCLAWVYSGGYGDVRRELAWVSYRSDFEKLSLLRLYIHSGVTRAEFEKQTRTQLQELMSPLLLLQALTQPWLPQAVAQIEPELRGLLLSQALALLSPSDPRSRLLSEWLDARFKAEPRSIDPNLRAHLAEMRLLALDFAGMQALIQDLSGPALPMFAAAQMAARGEWAEAAATFEALMKDLRKLSGARRGALSDELSRIYVLCLLAQAEPKAWTQARKFCIAESGSRKPSAHEQWGRWAHVIGTRLGEDSLDPNCLAYQPALELREHSLGAAADRLLLAAWAGKPATGWSTAAVQTVLQRLQDSAQLWLAAWVEAAAARLDFELPPLALNGAQPPANFLGAPREPWRDALAAIASLGEPSATKPASSNTELAWQITLDPQGRVQDLEPLERSLSARGVAKFKPVPLSRLKKNGASHARDNAVLRHIERSPYGGVNSFQIDASQAVLALIGHPALMFADAPGQWVELVEAQPELEVLRRPSKTGAAGEEQFEFAIHPPLVGVEPPRLFGFFGQHHETESAKRDALRILRDSPQRARLIRISSAQRRVAELVAQGWSVPASASAELGAALQVLSGLFQLHSDAEAGQEVPGDSRLRARLLPLGEGLQLQLVAQPFGSFGPAVTPGRGRERLMCMHEGLSLATQRDLAAETAARHAVLEALPFLDPELGPESPWQLADAEEALRVVELLPGLPGIAALDWPKGKPLRVKPLDSPQMRVQVSSGRDWLALEGQAQTDEGRVIGLQELLTLARASRSRFVRLGEGEYLALSEQLRQQLRDLDALGQAKKEQLQLPQAVASWLDDTLSDMAVQGDKPWQARIDALAQASALQPKLPAGLRAELRSYQFDGFVWMSRLAQAGLGACLADDMGLGKTVQTLALLVERAALGPALVLAPTSVCGNWLNETQQFAPGLRCNVYGEAMDAEARAALVRDAGPGDVLVLSYALAQIDAEVFAAKDWATLVMDEAQALKNAATKRAKSVAEFKAGFRLALSGTPVENRLADLWSIMNLINPGLLGSSTQFSERFATPIEKHQDPVVRQRLRRLVSPFLLRRTKTQVLQDLPPRTEIVHLVQPSSEERNFLEALRRSAQEAVSAAASSGQPAPMLVLAELMRLRRAACDPRLVAPELGLVGSKLAEFESIVRELVEGSHKALVFSQFTDYLKLLAERLDSMGLAYQYLDGSTPAAERSKRVAAFQRGEGEVFLISLKAGGFGLNLTMADYVLIVDPWWNPAAEDQATGRAHRMGQKRPVTVYRLVTAGSVEERIIDLHREKRGLADGILEGQEEATVLDAQALAALLRG